MLRTYLSLESWICTTYYYLWCMEKASRSSGLADQATLELRNYIRKQKFQPGDLLPGEIELSLQLGVSRTIIREALSRFRMMGIIDSRRRRGMILQSPDFLSGMELALDGSWLKTETLREMFEFRLMLEMGIGEFLFGQNRERLIKKLERIVAKELTVTKDSERMRLDAEFHAALYVATGNNSLIRFQKMLYPLFVKYASKRAKNQVDPAVKHVDLLEEIKTGTPESFGKAMRQHLEPHFSTQSNITE